MEVCYHNHDEIVFDGLNCPLCEANERVEELEDEVLDLRDTLNEYEAKEREKPCAICATVRAIEAMNGVADSKYLCPTCKAKAEKSE